MPPRNRHPRYCRHKHTGQAYVYLDGKRHYLGKYDSPESHARFRDLVESWHLRGDTTAPIEITIGDLCVRYLAEANSFYRKDGRPTPEVACLKAAFRFLMPYRQKPVATFSPPLLKAIRTDMIRANLALSTINGNIHRIRRMVRWGVEETFVRPDVLTALKAVRPLMPGRSEAREPAPIRPVDIEVVEATLPYLSPPLAAVVQILMLTGARTGEILPMRVCEIDRSVEPWEYRPRTHKNAHHGTDRIIPLGPRAQSILLPFFRADPEAYLFRPRAALRERYHAQALTKAVARAVQRANADREADGDEPIPHWHPHQLRHTAGTRLRREFGIEAAQSVLGHSTVDMTILYSERNLQLVREIADKIG